REGHPLLRRRVAALAGRPGGCDDVRVEAPARVRRHRRRLRAPGGRPCGAGDRLPAHGGGVAPRRRGPRARGAAGDAPAVAPARDRRDQRLRAGGGGVARVAGRAQARDAGGRDGDDRAAARRVGDRQGGDRALPAPRVGARDRAVRGAELRRAARAPARVPAVRLRAPGATEAERATMERARGGVLFLDEVGEMGLGAQAKLLRVVQEREFQRRGGTGALTADVRVVAATNRDLRVAIDKGTFREDLYYR